MATLNQIVTTIKTFAEDHGQIQTSKYGEAIDVISKGDVVYPAVFFNIETASMFQKQMQYTFNLYILDRQLVDGDELEVHSDCTLIAQDIVSLLRGNSNPFTIGDVQIGYVVETNPDYLAGVLLTFTLSTSFISDTCQIPT